MSVVKNQYTVSSLVLEIHTHSSVFNFFALLLSYPFLDTLQIMRACSYRQDRGPVPISCTSSPMSLPSGLFWPYIC